jgi:alkanesulfonate monooxygenase SsuD/methylene tetrahydromethanopterin reductase-like flavin-dependent oxidoreductase (luciferase family)
MAAMAARTTKVRFTVAALIAPFYDPLRLAEDMVVLDQLSHGRVDLIVGAGYVREEFDMYGVPLGERARRVTEVVRTLKGAFSGEPFAYRGRRVHVTPAPFQAGGPRVIMGGSSEAAARRAAHLGDGFLPSVPEVWDFYRDEMRKLARPDPGDCPIPQRNRTVTLATDPDRAWKDMGPYFLHETNAYGDWLAHNDGGGPYRAVGSIDQLREEGEYKILTPDEYVEELKAAPFPFAMLHPLCGGMPPELAWTSLRLFEDEVIPAL